MKQGTPASTMLRGVPTWAIYAATVSTGGFTWFVTKFQIGIVLPEVSLAYRFMIAAVVLTFVAMTMRMSLRFGIIDHLQIALLGLFIFFGSFTLIYLALEHLTSGLVALIFSMVLLINVLNSVLFLSRAFEPRVLFGAVLGLCGLVLVFWPEVVQLDLADMRTVAILQMLGAALLFSFGNVFAARLQERGVAVLPSTGLAMGYGAVFLLLFALLSGKPFEFDHSWSYISSLIYLSLIGSVVGYATYFIVIGRIGPERAAYSLVLTPVLALVVSTLFEDFTWTGRSLLGIALVLLGNVAVLRKRKPLSNSVRVPE